MVALFFHVRYSEAIKYLSGLERLGIEFGLEPVQKTLGFFDNPHHRFKNIHIAGTNGKGSTAAIICSILKEQGYKVGLYTSPHLQDVCERIQINQKNIGKKLFCDITVRIKKITEQKNIKLTYFEFLTVMGFICFVHEDVDIAVIETGMGGRLDATNVINPLISIITNIDLDHTEYLGKTKTKIAREKAGIIKGGPVITGIQSRNILQVLKQICQRKKTDLFCYGKDFNIKREGGSILNPIFNFESKCGKFENLQCNLIGEHQVVNSALAIMAIQVLNKLGLKVDNDSVYQGLRKVNWPGRFEIVGKYPAMILDGAHNPHGIKSFARALSLYSFRNLILVIGIMQDKNIRQMLKIISPLCSRIIAVKPQGTRSLDPEKIKKIILSINPKLSVHVIKSVSAAIITAKKIAHKSDLICVTGSLYTVGEARRII